MSKREQHDEGHSSNHERWLLTYSDMITLLLVLFIVMYTMSTVDAGKFAVLSEGLGELLNGSSHRYIGDGTANGMYSRENLGELLSKLESAQAGAEKGNNEETDQSGSDQNKASAAYISTQVDDFDTVYTKLNNYLKENNLDSEVSIVQGDKYLLLRFGETLLFYPNSSKMRKEALPVLKTISEALFTVSEEIDHIKIEGHTADVGLESTYAWRLSSERAITVLDKLVKDGHLPQEKMSIEAFSHYKPAEDNGTGKGLEKNRRVEILITKS